MAERKITAGCRRWLKRLINEAPLTKRNGHGQAPMLCIKAGWSSWVVRHRDTGEEALWADLRRGSSDLLNLYLIWDTICGEQITEAGRAALHGGKETGE
jgi:hypothetical protein